MKRRKVIVVTGATKGIGKAIVKKLASENYNVVLFGRDKNKLVKLKQRLKKMNSDSLLFSGDVSDEKFVKKSMSKVLKYYGKIDGVINNAGVAYFENFVDSNLQQFKTQIDTNVIGVYNFCKVAIPTMIKQKDGAIINIVSMSGKNGFVTGTMYVATKHAVMGFSKSLLLEVRKHNVKVITICPGSVETDMISNAPFRKDNVEYLKPNDVAEVVLTALKMPRRALVSDLEIRPTNI